VNYVFEIVLALLTLALPELGIEAERSLPLFALTLVLVPYLLGWAARRALLAGRFRAGAVLERVLVISPVLLQALAVSELGWLHALELRGFGRVTLQEWLDLGLLLGLFPYFLYQLAAIDARARSLVFPPDTPHKTRVFHLRLFGSAMVPFLAYLAGSNLIARSNEWKVRFEEIGLLGAALTVVLFGLFLYGMPRFLRLAWDTVPLERGWARTMLEQVARGAGFRFRELLVWRTGQQMSNAAVVGFSKGSRMVFFSDLLLQQLGPRELAAVFAHEMGHARRAHAVVFGAFAVGFFLGAQQLIGHLEFESELTAAALFLGVIGLWYLAFGYLSRRFELEADLESLRVVGESGPLIRALELVTGAHAHARSSWRHFSTKDRVEFLRSVERDPLVGIRLRRRLAALRKVGFTLFAVTALLQIRDLAQAWDQDWVVADLRLGHFEEAAARAQGPGIDPDVARLAQRAASVSATQRSPQALGGLAFSAYRRGDIPAALQWLKLGELRGGTTLHPLIEALESTGGRVESFPAEWQEVLKGIENQTDKPE
jgi:Zn-dependent protease with chaperone function